MDRAKPPRVLLLGAAGFLGRHIAAALEKAGCEVTRGQRRASHEGEIAIDFARDLAPETWIPRLAGVDVIINAVGILRETTAAPFAAIHRDATIAVLEGARAAGVRRFIQVSALGARDDPKNEDLAYFTSKAAADHAILAATGIEVCVLRPSLVFGPDGASSRALLGAASLPLHLLPGNGEQQVQPIHIDDLGELVARLATQPEAPPRLLAAVGPRALDFAELLQVNRAQLGLGRAWSIGLPLPLVRGFAHVAGLWPRGVLCPETLRMLLRGNTADPAPAGTLLARPLRPPEEFLDPGASGSARGQACWWWLGPLSRAFLALLWLTSGLLGLFHSGTEVDAWLARLGLSGAQGDAVRIAASMLDIVLAGLTLAWPRPALWLTQILVVLVFTLLASLAAPQLWLHPFAPLLKNLPILALLLALWAQANRPAR